MKWRGIRPCVLEGLLVLCSSAGDLLEADKMPTMCNNPIQRQMLTDPHNMGLQAITHGSYKQGVWEEFKTRLHTSCPPKLAFPHMGENHLPKYSGKELFDHGDFI